MGIFIVLVASPLLDIGLQIFWFNLFNLSFHSLNIGIHRADVYNFEEVHLSSFSFYSLSYVLPLFIIILLLNIE